MNFIVAVIGGIAFMMVLTILLAYIIYSIVRLIPVKDAVIRIVTIDFDVKFLISLIISGFLIFSNFIYYPPEYLKISP